MPNPYFQFKQFTIFHDRSAMKVTTDGCLFGAWCAAELEKKGKEIKNILDIGAGTGLLSLMLAQKNEGTIDAVEIDHEAAQQANENVSASPWSHRIKVYEEDIAAFISPQSYDVIISNPPFYENEWESDRAQKNIAHHGHGLKMQQLLHLIAKQLSDEGVFFLLLPYKRFTPIEKLLHEAKLAIHKKVIVRPSPVHAPFRVMVKGKKQGHMTESSEWCIRNEQQHYSTEFVELLRHYYLYL